jgi:hypothetical protein
MRTVSAFAPGAPGLRQTSIGFARRRNVWDMNSPVWQPIKNFLQKL